MIDISTFKVRLHRIGARWGRRIEAARISRELGASSDRALAELGIARGDISAIAQGRVGQA